MKPLAILLLMTAAAFGQAQSWLTPTDDQIQRAIDLGFKAQKPPYNMPSFNPQKSKIGDDYVQQPSVTVVTPLLCSYGSGFNAHKALKDKPEISVVKRTCQGKIIVTATHISPSLEANWPVVLERGGNRLQPAASLPDKGPGVTSYTTPFGKHVGYQYTDRYIFIPSSDWENGFQVTYSDDDGKHHSIDVKTDALKADLK